jgi:putative flippase GtrA
MPAADKLERPHQLIGRVFRFALVSGAGLALDFGLFIALVEGGVRTGWANLISAGVAVAFVYLVSVRRIFAYQGQFLVRLFACYAVYQFAAVTSASYLIDFVTLRFDQSPVWSKIIVLPLTFTANFVFMSWLTRTKPS